MTTISASKFKEQCLALLDNVGPEGIVITKHGKPVAKLTPMPRSCADLIGCLKGEVRIKGDIFSTGITWDAESRHPHLFARPQRRTRTRRTGPADR
jgi:prevent-host-death family protein